MVEERTLLKLLKQALKEDLGKGDITTQFLISPKERGRGNIIAQEEGILAGIEVAKSIFRILSPELKFETNFRDGDRFKRRNLILRVEGNLRAILSGERVALNFLQKLSGIATLTRKYVDAVSPYGTKILDTRKTTPLLRALEKEAVKAGGGYNHRFGLWDGILIKDNHLKLLKNAKEAIRGLKTTHPFLKVEVEAKTLSQLRKILNTEVEIIMLDNMEGEVLEKAIKLIKKERKDIKIEVSGRITLQKAKKIASLGVDYISVGRITHSAPSIDMSLEIEE